MEISTSADIKREYVTKRSGNKQGLYLSEKNNYIYITDDNGIIVGFFSKALHEFLVIKNFNTEKEGDDFIAAYRLYPAPRGFELIITQ